MKRILYWTSGMGTGHIKRANALWRGFRRSGEPVELFFSAERSMFTSLLERSIQRWNGSTGTVDAVILDHRLGSFPEEYADIAPLFIRLLKITSPAGTGDDSPSFLSGRIVPVSIENSLASRRVQLPYEGCLIDAGQEEIYSGSEARERIHDSLGRPLEGRRAIVHVNTAKAGAALAFGRKAVAALEGKADSLLVSTAHKEIHRDLQAILSLAQFPGGSAVHELHTAYRYYRAFDTAYLPSSYNTYCEAQLFFPGEIRFEPATFFAGRLWFRDQKLRAEEMPEVGKIGNEAITRRIIDLC